MYDQHHLGMMEDLGLYKKTRRVKCSKTCMCYAPIIVMPHLPQVGPGRGFCRGFVSRFVPRVGDLYHVFWYCACNFCAYEHHYTKAPTDPLSTIGDFESKSCP